MKLLKEVVFVGALIMSIVSLGIAQPVDFNVKGGVTYSSGQSEMSNNGIFIRDVEVKSQFGVYIGGVATFRTKNSKLKFQAELFYQLNKIAFGGEECLHGIDFHQITLPILAKYQLAENLNLTGGFYISANLKVVENYNRYDYTKTDIGTLLGLEYKLQNGITLDVRYNYGLTNMILDNATLTGTKTSYYNRTLNAGVVCLL